MMMYGNRMSVSTFLMRRVVGGEAFEKYPLIMAKAGMWNA